MVPRWVVFDAYEETKHTCETIIKEAEKYLPKLTFSMGISNVTNDIADLPGRYKEALDALRFGRMISGTGGITRYSELGIYRLLCQMQDQELLLTFIPEALKKLIKYDQKNRTDLTKSLEVYLNNNGSLKKSAENLFIHYKTVLYRIERIREITGLDLDSNNIRLELQVGFKILKLFGIDIDNIDKLEATSLEPMEKGRYGQ